MFVSGVGKKKMAKHQFGIMETAPNFGQEYIKYEPEKYRCVSIEDDRIETLLKDFSAISSFHHSLQQPKCGLAYCGITLIPPKSHLQFVSVIQGIPEFEDLVKLFKKAEAERKYVIHFGI